MEGAVHQVGTIVERAHLNARREFLLNLASFSATSRVTTRLLPPASISAPPTRDFLAIHRGCPGAIARTDRDLRHVPHKSGFAEPANLSGICAISSNVTTRLLARMTICSPPISTIPPPTFSCVLREPCASSSTVKAHTGQTRRVGHDNDLLFVATAGVHFGDSGRRAEQRADEVFLNLLERHSCSKRLGWLVGRAGFELDS